MKKPHRHPTRRKGSALITVLFLIFMMGLLTTSMLKYSGGERRGNERNRLILRAKNMAENVALYASEQVSTKVRKLRSVTPMQFSGTNGLHLPPSDVLATQFSTSSNVAVYGGIQSITSLATVTDTSDPNYGLQVMTGNIPIIASSTMTHPALGSVKAFVQQDLQINMVPLFQFAIFYDGDLEVSPGADMVISGPVHTNGNLIARCQSGFTNTVQFTDRVSVYGGFFANTGYKGTIYNEYDSADSGPGGTGPLYFQNPAGTVTNIKNSSSVWRDHQYGGSTVTTSSLANFKTFATTTYAGNLITSVHSVPKLELPGLDESVANNTHTVIEPASASDSAAMQVSKFSRNVGLYIIVNPDDEVRTGTLPDESTVTMLPRSYRCWLNSTNLSAGTHVLKEVVLPGQPSYGYNNNGTPSDNSDDYMYRNYLPNRYINGTSVGSNQVLRIPQQEYGSGSGYLINGALSTGATTINVDTGLGKIPAGEVVTIGNYRYLVASDLSAGSFTLAYPGLLENVADNATVTVNAPWGKTASISGSLQTNTGTTYAIGTTTIVLDSSTTGIIQPGDSISFNGGNYKYLVTGAPKAAPATTGTNITITIAPPGLRETLANNVALAVDTSGRTLGTAMDYFTSAALAGTSFTNKGATLSVGSGSGTLIPGNLLAITASSGTTYRYLVASVHTSGPGSGLGILATTANSDGATDIATSTPATLDPYPFSGYTVAPATLSNASTIIPDCYFYDLRRVTNSTGHPFSRTSNTFTPRPIAKIDLDMARFKMAVNRTLSGTAATVLSTDTSTTGYNVGVPNSTNWSSNILNASASTATLKHGLGGSYNTYPASTSVATRTRLDPFRIYFAPTVGTPPSGYTTVDAALADDPSVFATGSASYDDPWYDGVTIYVHSVGAENLTESATGVRNRIDSGVRLVNGRGSVISLATTGKTGFSFGTNDAAYLYGHFNADGTINATATSTTNPGGYSGRYPESSTEKLTSIMCDALTVLSQPVFTSSGSSYYQSSGFCDALSGNRCRTSNWGTNWATTNPGSGNAVDGVNTSLKPATMPTLGTYWPGAGTAVDTKFDPTVTEISACLLTGIVPTDSHQHSGGVHNYVRLLEDWAGTGLYIRGSMVAMFNSIVATEPWSIRIYSGAGRYWGLHESLRNAGHDVPLEPILLNAQRLSFRELSESEFNTRKTAIQAL